MHHELGTRVHSSPPANAQITPISSDLRKHAAFRSYAQVLEGEPLLQLVVYLGLEPLSVNFYHLVLGPWLLNIFTHLAIKKT
jgi:hypothetical protein